MPLSLSGLSLFDRPRLFSDFSLCHLAQLSSRILSATGASQPGSIQIVYA